jgi:hypothetical protein
MTNKSGRKGHKPNKYSVIISSNEQGATYIKYKVSN